MQKDNLMILVAGPYRSGTNGEPEQLQVALRLRRDRLMRQLRQE
jgi:hypothetical protein